MPMFPVIFVTEPVGAPHNRKDGELTAYAQGETLQEAEDRARVWLGDLSDFSRIYTPADKPARRICAVRSNPYPVEPARNLRANHFVIYAEK